MDAPTNIDQRRILDFGCAYGHMLDVFAVGEYETHGVEIVAALRKSCLRRGHIMYRSIAELESSTTFDVIASIDSLYYLDDPGETLRRLHPHLKPDGTLILRVTNRTHFLEALRRLHRPIPNSILGDSKYSFSFRGIELLCSGAGYRIERTIIRERGKRIEFGPKALYYLCSPVLSSILQRTVTPGIVLLCRKS